MLLDTAPCRKICAETEEGVAEKKIRRAESLGYLEEEISTREKQCEEMKEEYDGLAAALKVCLNEGPKLADMTWMDFLKEKMDMTPPSEHFLNQCQLPLEDLVIRISTRISKLSQQKAKAEKGLTTCLRRKDKTLRQQEKQEESLKRKVQEVFRKEEPEQVAKQEQKKTLGCTVASSYCTPHTYCIAKAHVNRVSFHSFHGPYSTYCTVPPQNYSTPTVPELL